MSDTPLSRKPRPKSKLEWALHLRDLGLQVFPLVHTDKGGNCSCGDPACKKRNRGKHPKKGSRGFKDATTDAGQIERWWKEDPDANIGVWAGPNRVWVDLDTKGEASGLKTLADFLKVDEFDLKDQTFAVQTPSGGIHMYYSTEVPVGDRVGILPNVDIRGQGGYVVGPGSTIGEKTYEVITERKIMPVPEGIQTVLRHIRERDSQAQVELFELDTKASINRAIDYLKRRSPAIEGSPEGGNHHTYVTSLQVRDLGISEEKCHELMLDHWNDRCDPPWDADELKVPIHNAFRYAKDRPGNKGQGIPDDFDDSEYYTKDSDAGEDGEKGVDEFARFEKIYYGGVSAFVDGFKEKREFIIPGVLPAQGYGVIVGMRGAGKSIVIVDAVFKTACDMEWYGLSVMKEWAGVYFIGEDAVGVKDFMHAWKLKYGREPDPGRLHVLDGAPDLLNDAEVRKWTEFMKLKVGNRRAIIVIDTWQRSTSKAKSQNEDADMQRASGNLEYMAKELNGVAIALCHPPKGDTNTVLGSSVIENMTTFIWKIEKTSSGREFEVIRLKGGPEGLKRKFELKEVSLGMEDANGQDVTSVIATCPTYEAGGLMDRYDDLTPHLPEYFGDVAKLLAETEKAMTANEISDKLLKARAADRTKPELPSKRTITDKLRNLPKGQTFELDGRRVVRGLDGLFKANVARDPWEDVDSQIHIERPEEAQPTIN